MNAERKQITSITFVDAFQMARRDWGDKAIVWVSARYPGKYTGPRYFVGVQGFFGLKVKGQGKSWRQALSEAGIKVLGEEKLAEPPTVEP